MRIAAIIHDLAIDTVTFGEGAAVKSTGFGAPAVDVQRSRIADRRHDAHRAVPVLDDTPFIIDQAAIIGVLCYRLLSCIHTAINLHGEVRIVHGFDAVGAVRIFRDLPLLVRITPKAPDVGAVFKLYFLEYLFYLHYNTSCKKLQVVKSTNIVIRIFTYTTHPEE